MARYTRSIDRVLTGAIVLALVVSSVGGAAATGTVAAGDARNSDEGISSTGTSTAGFAGVDATDWARSSSTAAAATDDVTFVSAEEEASTSDDYEVAAPADIQEGDLLIMTIGGTDGEPKSQADDGWTRIDICGQDNNADTDCPEDGEDLYLQMFYKVASSDEPSEYDVDADHNTVTSVIALRGADTDDPIQSVEALPLDDSEDVSTCPSTEGVDGGMLLCGFTHDDRHELENYGDLTLRTEDFNGDSSTQVATKQLTDGGDTDVHTPDHVDPSGNKDINMAVVVAPSDSSDDGSADDGSDDSDSDDGSGEGIHVIDDSTIEADYQPDFDIYYENYVYFGPAVNDGPREWQLMDVVSDDHYETTLSGLSAGDEISYQYAYWEDGSWQYTTVESETFQPDGGDGTSDAESSESGAGTNRLVYGGENELVAGEYLASSNGDYRLYFQSSDGNLVLRETSTNDALWATGTADDGGTHVKVQGDGNLVMYTDGSDPVWASDTAGSGADELVLEDDGALVLYDDGSEVWSVNDS